MINKDKLMNMLGCDDGFLIELFEKFISESSESINRINKALETNDGTTISGAAHKMLSSTRIFEMAGLSALLKEIGIVRFRKFVYS